MTEPISDLELARILIANSVSSIIESNANSYINANTEKWLSHARKLGAYKGEIIGNCIDVQLAWYEIRDEFVPKIPDSPERMKRLGQK